MLPCLVDFRSHPRRTSKFRHRDENPVTASPLQLCTFARLLREESALTNCDARNSFKFCFYENCRVVLVFLSKDPGFDLNLVFPSRAVGSLFSLFAPRAFYNSFPFRSIHTLSKNSGVAPPSWLHFSGCSPLESPLTYPLSFHALAHSLRQWGTVIAFVFMILDTLSASTGVYPLSQFIEDQNETYSHQCEPDGRIATSYFSTTHQSRITRHFHTGCRLPARMLRFGVP